MTVALLIQALLFGDGGILDFGANSFNIAFILPFLRYSVRRFIKNFVKTEKREYLAITLGCYIGLNAAALSTAIMFRIQPLLFKNSVGQPLNNPYPLTVSIPAIMIPHILVAGFVEAGFTVAIYSFIKKVSPGTLYEGARIKTKSIYGLIIALVILTPLGLLASGTAWGEWGNRRI